MLSGSPGSVLTVQIYLRYMGSVPLTDIVLTFKAPIGILVSQVSWTWQDSKASTLHPFVFTKPVEPKPSTSCVTELAMLCTVYSSTKRVLCESSMVLCESLWF